MTYKLTKKERQLCEFLEAGWIARDVYGRAFWYKEKPCKGTHIWCSLASDVNLDIFGKVNFDFIQWTDQKPWAVKDLLSLGVEE